MTDAAIKVENITFSYGDLEAVGGISFEVAPGEILGFLGPNGAGKSTTIKILTGQLTPKSGSAQVLGVDVTKDDPEMQAQIGVCFEEKNLYDSMSGQENLKFHASLFGIKDVDTDELLRRVGLADRAKDRVAKYSKGMKQRLMMARTLVNTPKVLFLDEPTDGLDPVSSQSIRKLIQQEADRGAAILLTTHDMNEADELSNRVAFINEGKLYAVDTSENLKLKHGKRSIRVRTRDGAGVTEQIVSLEESGAGEALRAAVGSPNLMTIHTEEATLEAIFIQMTGRGLEG
ncbi:MAG: ABC transporter ATP-binding protein [Acidimicrobiia bacterium]|nr:ABC transporter ATP-binding protein [Acidimicrobiia bacterium]MDH3396400.1 ABC transporter ATP-binding protein [Acidimicrobiia bacterium]MDH5615129.1 ABC transporter ATP-binding protein [Acidimicrobiia bacterium]